MIHDPMCVELNAFDNKYGYTTSCKCERLRAYAAKVRMETQLECRPTQQEVYDLIASAVADAVAPSLYAEDRYQQGYAAALDAARDAVAALPKKNLSRGVIATEVLSPLYVVNRDQALAAIDELRHD